MADLSLAQAVALGLAQRVVGEGAVRFTGIRHDSRKVEPGDLFVVLPHLPGADGYAADALRRGAVALLTERELSLGAPLLLTHDVLLALSMIAQRLYGDPTRGLPVVGITGTNGKTTTTYLVESILLGAGERPAVFGTVSFRGPAGVRESTHTTPMADDMMRLARWARDTGASHLVLEVSSHALAMHRADGVHFRVAAFTNLTHDHLDYHGSFENYAAAKRRLFEALTPEVCVLNVDDAFGATLTAAAHGRILRCSRRAGVDAEIKALSWQSDASGIRARLQTPQGEAELTSPLVGEHNLENLLIALGCGLALQLPLGQVLAALASARGAPGRLERVELGEPAVFVDYAHTPDGLERVLRALRPAVPGRLIALFGCGGDRDRTKRPVMGRLAVELADLAIATSDNPRSEPPEQILAEVEQGMRDAGGSALAMDALASASRGYFVCADRGQAIRLAVAAAGPGDCVLLAGKGHEQVQIIGNRRQPFDDREQARAALALRGEARR